MAIYRAIARLPFSEINPPSDNHCSTGIPKPVLRRFWILFGKGFKGEFANKDLNMSDRFDIFLKYLQIIHKATISLCDEKGAHFIDVRDEFDAVTPFQKRFSLFTDRMHFTEEGNALLADSIFQKIKGFL